MTDTCCIFHADGGPRELACDNYGHDGADGVNAATPDYDREPIVTFGDLIDWDVYSGADEELGSLVADALEPYQAS